MTLFSAVDSMPSASLSASASPSASGVVSGAAKEAAQRSITADTNPAAVIHGLGLIAMLQLALPLASSLRFAHLLFAQE
jgi:hypothetical protein